MLSYRNSYSHIHFKLIVLKKSGEIFLDITGQQGRSRENLRKGYFKS